MKLQNNDRSLKINSTDLSVKRIFHDNNSINSSAAYQMQKLSEAAYQNQLNNYQDQQAIKKRKSQQIQLRGGEYDIMKNNENKQSISSERIEKMSINFPQLSNNNSIAKLQNLQKLLIQKKAQSNGNGQSSLPKLKLINENQESQQQKDNVQKYLQNRNQQYSEERNKMNDQFMNKQNQDSNYIQRNKLKYRPKIKLMDYILTEPTSELISIKSQDRSKSLSQINIINSNKVSTTQNIPIVFSPLKQKQQIQQQQQQQLLQPSSSSQNTIPYLSTHIQQQEKEQQMKLKQQMNTFNESNDRRLKFACKTKAGCKYDKTIKINQDSQIIYPKQLGDQGIAQFAVCDGHGVNGHHISNMIRKSLPKVMVKVLKENKKKSELQIKSDEKESNDLNSNEQNQKSIEQSQQIEDIKNSINLAYYTVNSIILKSEHDSNLSGSTLVSVFISGNTIICGNVGDSRAILARQTHGNYQAIPLSIDHKPSLQREKQRIISNGGRVQCQQDNLGNSVGPLRVWMNSINIPGLAMTRSFGDKVGIQAGVNCEPEIMESQITDEDKFIIIASDGLWEHISNEQAINIVEPFYEKGLVEQAAEKLVVEASNAWKKESYSRDDITCIVVFIQNQTEQKINKI